MSDMVERNTNPLQEVAGVDLSDGWETTCRALHHPDGTIEIMAIERRFAGEAEFFDRRRRGDMWWQLRSRLENRQKQLKTQP